MTHERQRGEYRVSRGEYVISTNRSWLDLEVIYSFLRTSHWAAGVTKEIVERSIENSLNFGLYKVSDQIAFARVITDYSTFAYLAELFVLEPHRGRGLGKWLVEIVLSHPDLQGLQRWLLATVDAQGLYRQYKFTELKHPGTFMEIYSPYRRR